MSGHKKNAEGYDDPTPYLAIHNIEAANRKSPAYSYHPFVFICSPFRSDPVGNTIKARAYCRFAAETGHIPIAPHLYFPQFLREGVPDERNLGLFMGRVMMRQCRELWVFGTNITTGMDHEINQARSQGIPVRRFSEDCKEVGHA